MPARLLGPSQSISFTTRQQLTHSMVHPRFDGTAPEPRPGLPSGHMPHSFSMPFNKLLEEHSSTVATYLKMQNPQALRSILEEAVSGRGTLKDVFSRSFITTCGSGMSAAIIWLALQEIGVGSALYDEVCTSLCCPVLGAVLNARITFAVLDGIRSTRLVSYRDKRG